MRHLRTTGRLAAGLFIAALGLVAPADAGPAAADSTSEAVRVESGSGGSALIPIPIIFYTPETKFAFGASVLYVFGGDEPGTRGRPSTLSAVAIYTQKKQSLVGGGGNLLLDGGRTEVSGGVFYKDFPTNFYGVGNDTPESAREKYTPREFEAAFRVTRRVRGPLQIGATALATRLRVRETEPGRLLDQKLVPGADGGWAVGLGLLAGVDTRDAVFSSGRGVFAEIGVDLHDRFLGSDFAFTRHRADFRYYQPIFRSHVLAARVLGVFTLGNTPFQLMPQLGGSELLRGYYEGRFRERNLVAAQVEYRFPVYGRFGLAVFGSAGQVAHSVPDFRSEAFHYGGGFGARYLLSRESRLTLRVDQGYGEEGGGFYVSFGEAF